VPLVPAAVKGTDRLSRLGPLRVAFGRPLVPEGLPHELTEKLMAEIERLLETL
jgi:1-acyl-sn-glycerol-3-phosphate acyltransferase